jgi:hypothetical protein
LSPPRPHQRLSAGPFTKCAIILDVARGWESKSVEAQIDNRQAESETPGKKKPGRLELEKKSRRESIRLARARTNTALQSTQDKRYRALLERTLEHLDSELAKLG